MLQILCQIHRPYLQTMTKYHLDSFTSVSCMLSQSFLRHGLTPPLSSKSMRIRLFCDDENLNDENEISDVSKDHVDESSKGLKKLEPIDALIQLYEIQQLKLKIIEEQKLSNAKLEASIREMAKLRKDVPLLKELENLTSEEILIEAEMWRTLLKEKNVWHHYTSNDEIWKACPKHARNRINYIFKKAKKTKS